MSVIQPVQNNMNATWKKIFIILSIAIVIIMPLLSKDYGQSGDEWLEIEYGQDIYNYFFHGDKRALDYSDKSLQYLGMEMYGGLTNFYTEVLHHMFPNVPVLYVKHFCNALLGAIMMIFTGLLAQRISRKWSVGVVALLFIIFSPRIFGESMNNPKDIPHACGFIMGVYGLIALLQDFPRRSWRNAIILALGMGLTFGQRPAGGILLTAYFVLFIAGYYLLNKEFRQQVRANDNKLLIRLAMFIGGGLLVGYVIALSSWPYGQQAPIEHSLVSLKGMTNRATTLRVLFEGEYRYNNNMPWYYEFKWIIISNPVVIIVGVVLFLALLYNGKKQYGSFFVAFLLFCAFFPLLYMIYKESSVYDTWRHVFFVYLFWVVMGALGWDLLTTFISDNRYKLIPTFVAILGLTPAIAWTVRSHPNQYVYFNELQGGVKGAFGQYDLDYYQNTGKQAADWIIKNVKPIPGRKIHVVSNMLGFDKYFAKDTAWLSTLYVRYPERHHISWDYYVTYGRYISAAQLQNGAWPPANVVHTIEEDGAVLSAIIQQKSKAGIAAYDALQKNDFATAVAKYEEYLKTDTSDENVWFNYSIALASAGHLNEALNAINNAIKLEPSDPRIYQVQAEMYKAMGNLQAAQSAMNNAQALMMEEQEKVKPQNADE